MGIGRIGVVQEAGGGRVGEAEEQVARAHKSSLFAGLDSERSCDSGLNSIMLKAWSQAVWQSIGY